MLKFYVKFSSYLVNVYIYNLHYILIVKSVRGFKKIQFAVPDAIQHVNSSTNKSPNK